MKLLVRNLDRLTTEEELVNIFKEFGGIEYCTLVIDPKSGSSKGFGFIEMPNASEAKEAVKNLNYKTIGRNKIRVKTTKN
jgi:RNA recognition motif-containing protein|tara:strand:+ start:238 stop:477 length:240 start_codon:yes stop_codon:yes gene_type:complete